MLRLPTFSVASPTTVDEVVRALAEPGARLLAGGTDLLPNLKHRLDRPPHLVSLRRVRELRSLIRDDAAGVVRIGAGLTLTEIAEHAELARWFPALARAAGLVASPLVRNMATLGGNVNLDTRCRYVNQTGFWREALGGCLKAEGDRCWVVPKGRNCVAAMSSDCVPVLIAYDARIVLAGPDGVRELPLSEYYHADGVRHTVRHDGEVMTEIRVPLAGGPRRSTYVKWTVRKSIDFPLVSIALAFELAEDRSTAPIVGARVVVGVLGARPRLVTGLEVWQGRNLAEPEVVAAIAQAIHDQCRPLENVPYEAGYRRRMLLVHARRALDALASAG